MMVNGSEMKKMELGEWFITMKKETSVMKDNGEMAWDKAKDNIDSLIKTIIVAVGQTTRKKDMEH